MPSSPGRRPEAQNPEARRAGIRESADLGLETEPEGSEVSLQEALIRHTYLGGHGNDGNGPE